MKNSSILKSKTLNTNSLLKTICKNRGVAENACQYDLKELQSNWDHKDIANCLELILKNIDNKILIVSDCEIDSTMATVVLHKGLKKIQFPSVDFIVLHGIFEQHGLSEDQAREIINSYNPSLVILVNRGYYYKDGFAYLKKHSVQTLLISHSPLLCDLEDKSFYINSFDRKHKDLSTALVCLHILTGLRSMMIQSKHPALSSIDSLNFANLLDFISLSIVSEYLQLDANNRILVHFGLKQAKSDYANPSIQAMLERKLKSNDNFTAIDYLHELSMRIHASAKLKDKSTAIQCLISEKREGALDFQLKLQEVVDQKKYQKKLNRARILEIINKDIVSNPEFKQSDFIYFPELDPKDITSIASCLKDHLHKPTVVMTNLSSELLIGAVKSIKGFNVYMIFLSISKMYPGLVNRFGGFSTNLVFVINKQDLEKVKEVFHQQVDIMLGNYRGHHELMVDGSLVDEFLSLECARFLKNISPWGVGFPEPNFEGTFHVISTRIVGANHLKMMVNQDGGSQLHLSILFNASNYVDVGKTIQTIRVIYKLDINETKKQPECQLLFLKVMDVTYATNIEDEFK